MLGAAKICYNTEDLVLVASHRGSGLAAAFLKNVNLT